MRSFVYSCIAVLLLVVTCAAEDKPLTNQVSQKHGPDRCVVGAYLLNLSDFNYSAHTFSADLWIWTHTSTSQNLKPQETMEFTNAVQISSALASTEDKDGVRWSQRKVFGTFRHHWDLKNFPFDRHTLEVRFEESAEDTSSLVYELDTQSSSYRKDMELGDWKISQFEIELSPALYSSTFGDPGLNPGSSSEYSGAKLDITIERTELTSYFKLTAVAYVAFLLMLITCFIHMDNEYRMLDSLAIRLNLLGGSLFSCVLNMIYSSSVLGSEDGITLVDKVHILVLIYIVIMAVISVLHRAMLLKGWTELRLKQIDRWAAGISSITFIMLNGLLLALASSV
jgi:hypothetical protein